MHGFSQALQKVGLPRSLMNDRGSAMMSGEFTAGLERVGILQVPTLPRSPHVNGKQENGWSRVESRLLEKLRREGIIRLGSRIRARLATELASRDELLACLEHLLAAGGNASLMTRELRAHPRRSRRWQLSHPPRHGGRAPHERRAARDRHPRREALPAALRQARDAIPTPRGGSSLIITSLGAPP